MTAEKSPSGPHGVTYSDVDPNGNMLFVYATPGAKTIMITIGGDTLRLSQANITGLLPALTAFSSTGIWT
jgi:hypothetical protein